MYTTLELELVVGAAAEDGVIMMEAEAEEIVEEKDGDKEADVVVAERLGSELDAAAAAKDVVVASDMVFSAQQADKG